MVGPVHTALCENRVATWGTRKTGPTGRNAYQKRVAYRSEVWPFTPEWWLFLEVIQVDAYGLAAPTGMKAGGDQR